MINYTAYGKGKSIIEILNIGFEPLLTPKEYALYQEARCLKYKIENITHSISLLQSRLLYMDETEGCYTWYTKICHELEHRKESYETWKDYKEDLFKKLLCANTGKTRKLYDNRTYTHEDQLRNIAVFESDLTRCFECRDMTHSDDIISVVAYYTDIFDAIMHNGFDYKGRHYVFFTAGAGQTRSKKSTFVAEDKLNKHFNRLFCGLSMEDINRQGGMNTNKYLAYTSLCQTNSEIWEDFNIDRAIVVDDIEYEIPDQTVRYIYTESPEDKLALQDLNDKLHLVTEELKAIIKSKKRNPKGHIRPKAEIIREKELRDDKSCLLDEIDRLRSKYHRMTIQSMAVTIPFTDGFGIALKKMPTAMIRLPFMKGLMAYCPKRAFQNWCRDNNAAIHKITDIYGKAYAISEIDYIFTRSQFKMWQYYNNEYDANHQLIRTGWEVYKDNFKKYGCDACLCNIEQNVKLNAKTNYQILQTLTTEMTDEDIHSLASYDIDCLNGIGRDVQSMLNVLGANAEKNNHMSRMQQSLILYPEMLKDYYVKTLLKNTKDSMIKKFRSGKFNINGAYVFAIPDTLACLQWWFTDMDRSNPDSFGFVREGHVACNLFADEEDVDCLRSPHLDHAHCIRKNQYRASDKKWIKSNGVYISMKDTMSKVLMYDNDGDKLLVHNNQTIIRCARQFQDKYGMIPNYYDMPKAKPELLNASSLFSGITNAYHHGNIGTPSNEITKVWMTLNPESTKEEIQQAMEVIALRCVDVNFTIDYAKTLYKPEIPKHIQIKYKSYSNRKVPYFFIFAKNKARRQVEPMGKCNIDRISSIVKSNRIVFSDLPGRYSYKILMANPDTNIESEKARKILALYKELQNTNLRKLSHMDISSLDIDEKKRVMLQMTLDNNRQRAAFLDIIGESDTYITDVLVKGLRDEINKDTLWRLFGDIIFHNIETNLRGTKICAKCGKRYTPANEKDFSSKYCADCKMLISREKDRKKKQKKRLSA